MLRTRTMRHSSCLRLLVLAAALAFATACGSSADPGGGGALPEGSADTPASGDAPKGSTELADPAETLSAPFVCGRDAVQGEPRPGVAWLEELRAAAGLDTLEERQLLETTSDREPVDPLRAGTPCASASDPTACETAFAELSSAGETLRPPFDEVDFMRSDVAGYYLVYTKGDAVGKVSNRDELRALFPAVDSPAKALLYAHASGFRVECHEAEGWIREEADGWIVAASRDHDLRCMRTDVTLWMKRDGTIEERNVVEKQPDACT